jgi:hypothetical protein
LCPGTAGLRSRTTTSDTARAAMRETAHQEPGFATIFVYIDDLGLEHRTGRVSDTSGIGPVLGF